MNEEVTLQSDAVQTTTPEVTVDPSQSSAVVQPTPPAPKTERELAYEELGRREIDSYNTKGNNITNWISNDYDYDATQAGTLWVAGKINDVNTQMSFLEATLNEDLYGEMDLQKYYFDTNLATARAYAREKKHEVAYGYYRAAQEKALAEGQLTGWYLPAEANYMLTQWVVADEKIKDPNTSDVDKARAESVKRATSGWFSANNISERGVECLNSLYLKETIRHNMENERLQEQSLEIQRKANEDNNRNAQASYNIQLREFQFQTGQMELDMGYDLNNDNVIGHTGSDADRFGFYTTQKEWAMDNFSKAFMTWGSDRTKVILGSDYNKAYNNYRYETQRTSWLTSQIESGNGYITADSLDTLGKVKIDSTELNKLGIKNTSDIKDLTIKVVMTGENSAALFVFNKHGVAYQVTDGSIKLSNGDTVGDILNKQGLQLTTTQVNSITGTDSKGNTISMHIGATNASAYGHAITSENSNKYPGIKEKALKAIDDYTSNKGYTMEYGLIDLEKEDESFVLSKGEGDKKEYYAVDPSSGDVHKIKNTDKVAKVIINSDGSIDLFNLDNENIHKGWNALSTKDYFKSIALSQCEKIGKSDGLDIYMYTNNDGTKIFFKGEPLNMGTIDDKSKYLFKPTIREIITESEARDIVGNIDEVISSRDAYINKTEDKTVTTPTVSDIISDSDGTATESEKKATETEISKSVHNVNDTTVKEIKETSNSNKSDVKATQTSKKSSEEQVIEDHDKYVTAFAAGEVMKQVEDWDKEILKQLGLTQV